MRSIKELLVVRTQTHNDTVCVESGLFAVKAFVKKRQVDFLKKVRARPDFETSPLTSMMDLGVQYRSPMGKYLIELDKETQTHCSIGNLERDYRVPPPLKLVDIGISIVTCQFTRSTSQTITYMSCIILLQQDYGSVPIDSEEKLVNGLAYQEKKECVHVVKMSRPNPMYCSSALKLQFCDWNITILTLIA